MPLLKSNDFWKPKTYYYNTERYKSLIEKDNTLYICNESHLSQDEFDATKFNVVGGIVPRPIQHSMIPNPLAVSPLWLTDSNEFTINIDSSGGYDPNPTFSIHLTESCFNSGRLVIVRIKPQIDLGAIDFNYGSLHSPVIISGTAAGNMQILTFEKRSDYVELIALSTVSTT